ncbi:DUF1292 domain-containing protein [Evtepia sp.]|uniref:DUF1292 domain-containing protein n=1 Tax=Evtepia sp. TaxID=2773933 RepID=UPI003F1576A2
MSEEYGANFITVTDEEGNEFELEHLDTIEFNGTTYMAFFPAVSEDEEDNDEEELGLILMKVIQENGEEILSTLDSEEETDAVYTEFMKTLFEDEDEE